MMLVKFCYIEKTGRYIGWAQYNNGTYCASGDTPDKLIKNLQVTLKYRYGIHESTILDTKPSPQDEMPIQVMDKKFVSKQILGKHPRKEAAKKRFAKAVKFNLLDRETLERGLREMAGETNAPAKESAPQDIFDTEHVNDIPDGVIPQKPTPMEYEHSFKVVEKDGDKYLTVFALVKVAEWKLAQ